MFFDFLGGHASKQQMSSLQEGEFGVKYPVLPGLLKSLNLDLKLSYVATFYQNCKRIIFAHIITHTDIKLNCYSCNYDILLYCTFTLPVYYIYFNIATYLYTF